MTTDLWITQIIPNTRDRAVLKDLRDATHLHRRIMTLFPEGLGTQARHQAAALFRLEEQPTGFGILVQSGIKPVLANLPTGYGTARTKSLTPLLGRLSEGVNVHYRIIANATSKLGKNTTAGRPKQVVPLTGTDLDHWWQRQAATAGLVLHSLHSSPLPSATGRRGDARMTHARTRFDGTATVTDPQALTERIRTGIGRGKSFGCGLLTIAPA
ncbi:type I-E CRISPR-associated protein Cas6/Cse3/CasE [Actinomadura sp. NEAU-AAG7]|uniref:type I-E CRISPR-associated protein Cas6/Cse3/CasE n=1 Tax=Actinomadura sp. NEAU-AAG7 TaxID=2839640 RepID=UPI001BE46B7D|nr:type I-E CRISPR-associated protein Cas6/Cse3/CasE [Actinomadura sp. NEAU-AAG7]MBT2207277.1 type I-E CRISPR-associated protein Cas6/Cse3/CasE [Actinomadura sp. NEAU-AAG7]